MQDVDQLLALAQDELSQADDAARIDAVRVKYLGKKGLLTAMLMDLKSLDPEQRPVVGQQVNRAKAALVADIQSKQENLSRIMMQSQLRAQAVDVTLPGAGQSVGGLHPVTQSIFRMNRFFRRMGFSVATGPQVEDEFHNFEALNIPAHHPARESHDTFYFDAQRLLRSHTSNVQIRVMQDSTPPIRVIAPGKVYRCDSDLTHTPMFHQIEGLWVDESVTFADMKGVLSAFINDFFEKSVEIRLRPSYFPFTEPSAEVDIQCVHCDGAGCRTCSHTGWLEVLGCGMVHPNVLRAVNIDPERYQGFAFGMGIDRFTMLRYHVDDLRVFFENDWHFLTQFKG